ncbi:type IV secretory system conjugative DNA transfer family protein [Xanthomonas fragariae]|uniref:Conjugal transfer protein TraG n=1 Tax=Xanthomonas fragariae TaxID=48664 RepID=A0A1Y6HAH7_9XANT|nr:type IV secretory system conjugative DNA transfer family protein [Xanthomonas fragariae]AOD15584.1 type IV secretion system protein VirD4 [Xanthomonas fragariae]AOD18994.1 type IV secretion system protein VirD4 [Xanthomonas fragariae]MBL9196673.1 type IV secretory system conjugative DNA transfer family protein [Xanthomonas fragariae]MBL9221434.1 type IV secretory system conjugative DNA transfer family protein [Xanthomonas fragariae]MDM7555170.1 type IV secretory system conjugative DNA trans
MSSKGKVGVAAILLILALVAGMYLSGFITLALLKLQVPLKATTYLEYWKALDLPQVKPYVLRIKISGILGFGLPLLGWALLLIPMLKSKQESLHGEASFATVADLKKAGMLDKKPESILVGKLKGRYIYINGALHVIVVAPTRSGKTTSIAIPVLLTYQQSMVVLDLKGELFKATSGYRASQSQQIYVWAPYATDGRTHRFNPLTLVPDDPRERIASIQTMAAILYPDEPGKDSFWVTQPRAAFVAFACFMFERWDRRRNLGFDGVDDPNQSPLFPSLERILRFSSGGDGGESTADLLKNILTSKNYSYISPQTRSTFNALAGLAEQTFSSVIATMQAPLQQFLSPILAAATNATDIDVTAIRKRLTTVYVIIPTQKLDESSKLLNIFFSSVIGNNLDKQLHEDPELKYQMLMLMDEFTAMGRVDVWAKRISISASYGVRDLCIIQSQSQLRATYGADDAQNFITNHAASIVFPPREQEDANAYSDMLGYRAIRKQNRSTSRGGGTSNVSYSYTEERRALMLPQEIKELPGDNELLFFEGSKPILCEKNWFFKDKVLKNRIMDPVTVPALARDQAAK